VALTLFNSKSGRKEPFSPLAKDRVKMYVCGPTVYNYVHIGNGLCAVVFDTLFRVLGKNYSNVTYVRNITDMDDRINEACKASGEDASTLTARYTEAYSQDVAELGCLRPTSEPKATDYIDQMIRLIERLLKSKNAYLKDDHVLFHVPSCRDYGQLSNRSVEDLLAGARVELADYKKHPSDFVLWKPSLDTSLPGWDSPWGRGRPGWHLECTAMIHSELGKDIDIHGGGHDLQFPHHENELAQGRCLEPDSCYAKYWLHSGLLRMDGNKMSKSLGNFLTIRSLLKDWDGETLRYALLSGHYRAGIDWSDSLLERSRRSLDRLYRALQQQSADKADGDAIPTDVRNALEDDLNTPAALAALHQKAGQIFQASDKTEVARLACEIRAGGQLLGLCQRSPESRFQERQSGQQTSLGIEQIKELVSLRDQARAKRDFARADELRKLLAAEGIEIEDTADGGRWHYRRD